MRKFLAAVLSMMLLASLIVLPASAEEAVTMDNIKIGFVHVSDPSDMGYTYNHDLGTKAMQAALGLADDQIINKYNVPETDECADALQELIDDGCTIIFGTSFGFENYMLAAAEENPDVEFCHATGFQAAGSGLANMHNYFGKIFEARYLSGVVAGMKSLEIKNNMLGYVTAMPFAECISGFTSFYLGAKSVNPDVTMKVMYTNSWNDPTKEAQVAQALIDQGCGILSQHCDSTATATTCEANKVFHVGYNSSMISVAPNASLTSAVWDWSAYLIFAVNSVVAGEAIPADWAGDLASGMCDLSEINEAIAAPGTDEAVETARAGILSGDLKVFAGPLTGAGKNYDGSDATIELKADEFFDESGSQSAPSWNYIIPGVEVIGE
ncbi:MAG: BMP family ABC transporter substrate-binding protein [Clostridiales bacterium]|nr:BMP family ABC transporter substrate-binding protein [Clostridiales bacterium]